MRIVIDTSVLVSAILAPSGTCARLLDRVANDPEIVLVTSDELVDELRAVFSEQPLRDRVSHDAPDLDDFAMALIERAQVVVAGTPHTVCRDPADDMVLEAARAAQADCIVSGDKDLLEDPNALAYASGFGASIVSVREMWSRISGPTEET